MRRPQQSVVRDSPPLATGPTISASHAQVCRWCSGVVAGAERITYTAESGWCHASCTTKDC